MRQIVVSPKSRLKCSRQKKEEERLKIEEESARVKADEATRVAYEARLQQEEAARAEADEAARVAEHTSTKPSKRTSGTEEGDTKSDAATAGGDRPAMIRGRGWECYYGKHIFCRSTL